MFQKKPKRSIESSGQRRIVRTSELRSSQYTYHGDRREKRLIGNNDVPRQMRRPDENPTRGLAQEARGASLIKIVRRRRFGYSIAVLAILSSVVALLFLQTSPSIELVKGYENQQTLRQNEVYQKEATKYLSNSLANQNKITVDGEGLERHMRQTFPELQLVQFTLPLFGSRPVVVIQPSRPLIQLQTSASGTYIVDESGYAIATAEDYTGDTLPIVVDQTALTVSLGKQVLPKSSTVFITSVIAQYVAKSLPIESIILPQSAYELNVRTSGDSYYVRYSMLSTDGAVQQIGSYFSMKEYLSSKGIVPAEYLDVRLSGRAYYK